MVNLLDELPDKSLKQSAGASPRWIAGEIHRDISGKNPGGIL